MSLRHYIKYFDQLDWIVVPGGPGLSADYLKRGLVAVLKDVKLHFYHPLGSPKVKGTTVPKIADLVNQIFKVAQQKQLTEYGLITHSFGSYLALKALAQAEHKIRVIFMISPMPFTARNWRLALGRIIESMPRATFAKILELSLRSDTGNKIFEMCLPYYITQKINFPPVAFDFNMGNRIADQIEDYDHTSFLWAKPAFPWVCITGENDPFFIERKLLEPRTIVLPRVGHYPFFENPQAFIGALEKIRIPYYKLRKRSLG